MDARSILLDDNYVVPPVPNDVLPYRRVDDLAGLFR
jgi:hypothetical protein